MKPIRMNRIILWSVSVILAILGAIDGALAAASVETTPSAPNETRVPLDLFKRWDFDKQAGGQPPAGFSFYAQGSSETAPWLVERDLHSPSAPNVIRPSGGCSSDDCLQILLADALQFDYLDLVVRIRLGAEESTGAAGLVFGARDDRNFYAATVDRSGRVLEVIRVLEGKVLSLGRTEIPSRKDEWHVMRVRRNTIMSKEYIEVFFDGQQVFSIEDQTFRTGQIGLMTRGTSAVAFDNLTTSPLYSQRLLSAPSPY